MARSVPRPTETTFRARLAHRSDYSGGKHFRNVGHIYQTTRQVTPEDRNIDNHRRGNTESHLHRKLVSYNTIFPSNVDCP
jgi:hypothetical protein